MLLALAGCPSNAPDLAEPPQSESAETPQTPAGGLLSSVHMADPAAEPQLLEGFFGVEQGVWRWTARTFTVALQPPGAQDTLLEFKFTVPDAVISRLGSVTLTARVNGVEVGSESYENTGEFVFEKPVPASALQGGGAAKVQFELDKALPPGEADQRELGVVAISVALK